MSKNTANFAFTVTAFARDAEKSREDVRHNLARAAEEIARMLENLGNGRDPGTCEIGNVISRLVDADKSAATVRTLSDVVRAFSAENVRPEGIPAGPITDDVALDLARAARK
jgi:hypothetical protein